MTGMQIAVDLRDADGAHTVRRHILAEDQEHAKPWIDLFNGYPSTRAGHTEVITRTLTHPDRQPEGDA